MKNQTILFGVARIYIAHIRSNPGVPPGVTPGIRNKENVFYFFWTREKNKGKSIVYSHY